MLTYYYLVVWPKTIEELNHYKKIDLFIYTGNHKYDLEYKAYLEPFLHNYINIHVCEDLVDWDYILKDSPYQMILTPYYIEPIEGRYIYYSQSIADADIIAWLYKVIRKINDKDISDIYRTLNTQNIELV